MNCHNQDRQVDCEPANTVDWDRFPIPPPNLSQIQLEALMVQLASLYSPKLCQPLRFTFHQTCLGNGVSASVYKVDIPEHPPTVMKSFVVKNSSNPHKILRGIHYELEILRRLNHPNIIYPLGITWDLRSPKVFFPYYPSSLRSFVLSQMPNQETVFELVRQLISAVDHLHQNGVVHGDIKPDNIMIESFDPIKLVLCDFGSAVDLNSPTFTPMSGLTEQYCSPQLALDGVITQSSDIFALGLTIQWLFTGSSPWPKAEKFAILAKLKAGEFPSLNSQLPSPIPDLVLRLVKPTSPNSSLTHLLDLLRSDAQFNPFIPQSFVTKPTYHPLHTHYVMGDIVFNTTTRHIIFSEDDLNVDSDRAPAYSLGSTNEIEIPGTGQIIKLDATY